MIEITRRSLINAGLGRASLAAIPAWATRAPGNDAARRLIARSIVIDGNLAVPLDPSGPLDHATAAQVRASGLTAAKLTLGGSGNESMAGTLASIAETDRGITANRDLFMKIASAKDFLTAKRDRRLGIIYSFEAGEMLEGRVENIDRFAALGVRVMGLSYNLDTPFASGVLSRRSQGLTPLGHEAVARMNARGVTIDVSHSDETSSVGAIAASNQPVLITHAGCDAIHAHPRNKSDRLLRALAGRGGVIGIYELSYLAQYPAQPSMADYFAHLTHALKICGEDHVGIGSDALLTKFDTSPENMADWNKDIAQRKASGVAAPGEGPPPFVTSLNRSDRCEIIAGELLKRGYRTNTVEKVLGANFQRVFTQTWGRHSEPSTLAVAAVFDLEIPPARREAVEVTLCELFAHLCDLAVDQRQAIDELRVWGLAVARHAPQTCGHLLIAADELGKLFADELAHFGGGGFLVVEPGELELERFQPDADLVRQRPRRRRQRRALRIEPAVGLLRQSLEIGLAQPFGRDRGLARVDREQHRRRDEQRHHRKRPHDAERQDQPDDRRGYEDRDIGDRDPRDPFAQPRPRRLTSAHDIIGGVVAPGDPGMRRARIGDRLVGVFAHTDSSLNVSGDEDTRFCSAPSARAI